MLLRLGFACTLVVLTGCGQAVGDSQTLDRTQERIRRASEAAAQPPKVTRRQLDGGELLILEIPVRIAPTLTDTQTCFVWRDSGGTSMQCPAADSMPVIGGPERDSPNF